MRNVWFTSDPHFGHANILKLAKRIPFLSDEERGYLQEGRQDWRVSQDSLHYHDECLLKAINDVVMPDDVLWVLGDFCMGRYADAKKYRDRIVCKNVNLVWGNHDRREVRPLFDDVMDQGMISVESQQIWLNHYPMRSWDKSFHGSWHLYGHVHGRMKHLDDADPYTLTRDAGVDANDYKPFNMAWLRKYMAPRIEKFLERKNVLIHGKSNCDWA